MKPSKRNIANKIAERERLAAGKPVVSKFERKNMTDEQYQELIAKERELRAKERGGVK